MAEVLQPLAQEAYNSGNVKPFMQKAFGDKLASSDMYCALVGAHLQSMKRNGVLQTIQTHLN